MTDSDSRFHTYVEAIVPAAWSHLRKLIEALEDPLRESESSARRPLLEAIRTRSEERLVQLLHEASDACKRNLAWLWAYAERPPTSARVASINQLLLERVNAEMDSLVAAFVDEGSRMLSARSRRDLIARENRRLPYDALDAEQRGSLREVLPDYDVLDAEALVASVEEQGTPHLLGLLETSPEADLHDLAILLSRETAATWSPIMVLHALAQLRARAALLTSEQRALVATQAIVKRGGKLHPRRIAGSLAGLELSEQEWRFLVACSEVRTGDVEAIARRLEMTTGLAIERAEILARAAHIRMTALLPLIAAARADDVREVRRVVAEFAAALPDARQWESEASYRARTLTTALFNAMTNRPGPKGTEKKGAVAFIAAVLAGLDDDASVEFATEEDPGFTPPTVDSTRVDPTETLRKRITNTLDRQPALDEYWPHAENGRRVRRDAIGDLFAQVPLQDVLGLPIGLAIDGDVLVVRVPDKDGARFIVTIRDRSYSRILEQQVPDSSSEIRFERVRWDDAPFTVVVREIDQDISRGEDVVAQGRLVIHRDGAVGLASQRRLTLHLQQNCLTVRFLPRHDRKQPGKRFRSIVAVADSSSTTTRETDADSVQFKGVDLTRGVTVSLYQPKDEEGDRRERPRAIERLVIDECGRIKVLTLGARNVRTAW